MAKFIITRVGDKHNRKTRVVKERVELHVVPLIGCFLLSVGIWMFVVGTEIREEELRAAQQAELFPPVSAETLPGADLNAPETAGQEVNEAPDAPAPGTPSASS